MRPVSHRVSLQMTKRRSQRHGCLGRERQEALSELFFSRVAPKQSLVFFYTKSGHPLDESINRLIVGVGTLDWISGIQRYEASAGPRYPLWDRLFTHSIRPDGVYGMLLPYTTTI